MAEVGHVDPLRASLRGAVAGDAVAMRRLIDGVAPSVYRVARTILGPGGDVEDATQESLLALVGALGAYRGDCSVLHYACRIAVWTAVRARRRAARRAEKLAATLPTDRAWIPETVEPGSSALAARRRELLRGLLDELPDVQAQTLALRVVLGCSMIEVAEATGAPVNTVRSRLRLAKEALRKRIENDPLLAEMLEVAG